MPVRSLFLAAALAACASGGVRAATTLPDTPPGRLAAEWLRAYMSGNADTVRAFYTSNLTEDNLKEPPLEERVGNVLRLRSDHRRLEVGKIETSSDRELTALLYAPVTEEYLRMFVSMAEGVQGKASVFRIQPIPAPDALRSRRPDSDAAIAKELDRYLARLVDADLFSGAVLVAHDGKPFYRKAFGLASRAYNVPNRIDTRFNLGSMNKMFTAVAIAQLAEHGKLSYDDTVGKWLPDFPNKDVRDKVAVRHLLSHTSGLGSYFNDKWARSSREMYRTVSDYLPLVSEETLAFEPGARFSYSNSGFLLLGAIVEKASGQDYFTYIREHVYQAAGMDHSGSFDLDDDPPNLAIGYTNESPDNPLPREPRRTNVFMHVIRGGPAGGGYSTVDDLFRFAEALRNGKLLRPASVDQLWAGAVDAPWGPGARYGFGFEVGIVNGQRLVGHGGGFPGINSQLDIYRDSGYTVAVMSNYDPPAAQRVSNRLREWLTRK